MSNVFDELVTLRAQLEAVTRERNGLRDELEARNTALRECEALREAATRMLRGEMLARCDAESRLEAEPPRAEADAARLREALEALVEYERKRHPPKMGGDEFPPSLREIMYIARAALASAPSAEPTPRDMRVAEAVREACARIVATRNVENWMPEELANEIRAIDLAAVVAKAVKP